MRIDLMKNLIVFIFVFCQLSIVNSLFGADKTITMVYKDREKKPLIGDVGDNSGAYIELFEKAANMIGYRLKIVRVPKKRAHKNLMDGIVDFYPGSSFSIQRAEYLYYLQNGFLTKEVLVSKKGHKEVKSLSEINGILLIELGSSKEKIHEQYPNIAVQTIIKLPVDIVVDAIAVKERGDFYIADIETIDYYKKKNNVTNYESIGLKIHHNAINQNFIPMNFGFSQASPYFKSRSNPDYNKYEKVSLTNMPIIIDQNCVAYKLHQALMTLQKRGVTQNIYNKHFK